MAAYFLSTEYAPTSQLYVKYLHMHRIFNRELRYTDALSEVSKKSEPYWCSMSQFQKEIWMKVSNQRLLDCLPLGARSDVDGDRWWSDGTRIGAGVRRDRRYHLISRGFSWFKSQRWLPVPYGGWFLRENPIKGGWFGGTPIYGNPECDFMWVKQEWCTHLGMVFTGFGHVYTS